MAWIVQWNNEGGGVSGTIALAGRADGLLAWEVLLILCQNKEQEFMFYLARIHESKTEIGMYQESLVRATEFNNFACKGCLKCFSMSECISTQIHYC